MLGQQAARTYDDIVADVRIAQDDGTHAHQAVVADVPAVDDSIVPNGDTVTDNGRLVTHDMNGRIVLDVRSFADDDRLEIPSYHGTEPHAGIVSQCHIAHH